MNRFIIEQKKEIESDNYDENGNISIERQGEDFEVEYDIRQEIVGYQENGESIYRMNFAVGTEEPPLKKEHEHTQRQYAYDERDRMIHTLDYNINVYFTYGEDGNRTNKYDDNRNKETLYFNQYRA